MFTVLFYQEKTTEGILYLDTLEYVLIPRIYEDDQERRVHFHQDNALSTGITLITAFQIHG